MLHRLRQRAGREEGFTLIELLVVILIIGILAAIAIPSFLNQRGKAYDAAAQTLANTAETTAETYATSNNGSYVGMTAAKLAAIEQTINTTNATQAILSTASVTGTGDNVTGTGPDATGEGYTVTAVAANTGDSFSISRADDGALSFTCIVGSGSGEPGGCVHGTW